ncbi:MAG TPA: 6-phosphogluconolactonase [Candidatus Paceibacterota bacterium]|nr:6-phosphogluconolactonase [Candidatus Paceibacterota bacterium]
MEFVPSIDPSAGVAAMAARLASELGKGKVLWLVCGGSNIPLSARAMDAVRAQVAPEALANLTVGLTDERYGPLGHADSNWKQLEDAHFNVEGIKTIPILTGKPLAETVAEYARHLEAALAEKPFVVAQFGIGADGHIAGTLPHTSAVASQDLVYGYEAAPFVRITLALAHFSIINAAYAFAFGGSKKEAIFRLKNEDLRLEDLPCQILKRLPEAYFYTDQIG